MASPVIESKTRREETPPLRTPAEQESAPYQHLISDMTVDTRASERLANRHWILMSDLHMGVGDMNNFKGKSQLFIDFIQNLHHDGSTERPPALIFLGDVFECWQGYDEKSLPNLQEAAAEPENAAVLDAIAKYKEDGGDFIYVAGNHDAVVGRTDSLPEHRFFERENIYNKPLMIETDGIAKKHFVFMHSHEVDTFNDAEHEATGRFFSRFAGHIERLNGGPYLPGNRTVEGSLSRAGEMCLSTGSFVKKAARAVWHIRRDGWQQTKEKISFYWKELIYSGDGACLKEHIKAVTSFWKSWKKTDAAATKIFTGHTHHMGSLTSPEDGQWYANSGTWAGNGTRQFAQYDYRNGVTAFLNINEAGKIEELDDMEIRVSHQWKKRPQVA
jgi:UDP-2,3-diacylglucosamine pyrophosphatase LpxH